MTPPNVNNSDHGRGSRLIFVGGAARSGTTLVQNMLDCHPDICGAPEFHHLPDFVHLRRRIHHNISKKWIDIICTYNEVDQAIASLAEELLLPLANKHNCKYLSEKTPANVLVFPDLVTLFPHAKFIHVIRDPRAIIASLLQVGKRSRQKGGKGNWYNSTLPGAIYYVKQCMRAGLQVSTTGSNRVLTVRYEDLVSDPRKETRKICQFLNLNWHEEMIYPENVRHLGEKAQCNEIWYDQNSFNRNPESTRISNWKNQLSWMQIIMIAASFKDFDELAKYGYQFRNGKVIPDRLADALSFLHLDGYPGYAWSEVAMFIRKLFLRTLHFLKASKVPGIPST